MHDPATPETEQVTGDARGRRTAGLVLVLIVAFIGVAIAKPWGSPPASTSQSPAPLGTLGAAVSPSPAATGTAVPSPAAPTPAEPSADAFTMPVPPPETATWTGIRWQRLASDDPLRLIRSMLRWRGGYIAVGSLTADGITTTPVWTSRDGGLWTPMPFGTATTFWPGLLVVGVAEVPSGLVALTLLDGSYQCGAACPTYSSVLPLMAWFSPDGRSWIFNTGLDLGLPSTWKGPPLLAAGPAGLVVASPEGPTRLATSGDGLHWRTLPATALPAGVTLRAIVGTATGFTAVGYLPVHADRFRGVAVQSLDGVRWSGPFPLHVVTASGVSLPGYRLKLGRERTGSRPSWADRHGHRHGDAGRHALVAVGQRSRLATPAQLAAARADYVSGRRLRQPAERGARRRRPSHGRAARRRRCRCMDLIGRTGVAATRHHRGHPGRAGDASHAVAGWRPVLRWRDHMVRRSGHEVGQSRSDAALCDHLMTLVLERQAAGWGRTGRVASRADPAQDHLAGMD